MLHVISIGSFITVILLLECNFVRPLLSTVLKAYIYFYDLFSH